MGWSNGLAHWIEGDTAFVSVAFSWRLREARRIAEYYQARGLHVRAGGTILAIPQNQRVLAGMAEFGGVVDALVRHNPAATIASRGCPVGCWFCIVPKAEGKTFTLIPDFVPRPILCDNNLSALPIEFQNHIIKRYQETQVPLLDVNSGFEPSTFDEDTYERWRGINRGAWRFAFDETKEAEAEAVKQMAQILTNESARRKRVYVLIGNEPIAQCYERVARVIEWGCEPYAQAVLPLNALDRHGYKILFDWDATKLVDFQRWVNRWLWRSVPLWEYSNRKNEKSRFAPLPLFAEVCSGSSQNTLKNTAFFEIRQTTVW